MGNGIEIRVQELQGYDRAVAACRDVVGANVLHATVIEQVERCREKVAETRAALERLAGPFGTCEPDEAMVAKFRTRIDWRGMQLPAAARHPRDWLSEHNRLQLDEAEER